MTTNLERAQEVSRHVQIHSVTLSSASVTSEVDPVTGHDQVSVNQSYRASYELRERYPHHLHVFVSFRFTASRQNGDAVTVGPLLSLRATYLLVYELRNASQYPADALQHFATLNGAYNAWPYWREMVQTVSGRVGLGAIVVPVFRPPVKQIPAQQEEQLALPEGSPDGTPSGAL